MRHSEKGFTLIELLVVVAILGILAAVIILNVMSMMGSGRVEAANTEAHNVQIAVLAAMVQEDVFSIEADSTAGAVTSVVSAGTGGEDISTDVTAKITGTCYATYELDASGAIEGATAVAGGKWDGLEFALATGWFEP